VINLWRHSFVPIRRTALLAAASVLVSLVIVAGSMATRSHPAFADGGPSINANGVGVANCAPSCPDYTVFSDSIIAIYGYNLTYPNCNSVVNILDPNTGLFIASYNRGNDPSWWFESSGQINATLSLPVSSTAYAVKVVVSTCAGYSNGDIIVISPH
jgi:hypothetical protein